MKKILFYILICLATFSGCKKDDDPAFDKSLDARLNEALTAYQAKLSSAQNGWKVILKSGNNSVYSFFMKFNTSNRVFMYADINQTTASVQAESSYRLKALQQPSLIFDTYSYLHLLSDPDPNVNNGEIGLGLQSDFEFYFDTSSADTLNLVGRVNNSKATFVRATAADEAAYTNNVVGNLASFSRYNANILQYWKNTSIGGVNYTIKTDSINRSITFIYLDATGKRKSFTTSYYITPAGIILVNPFVNGGTTVSSITNVTSNAPTINITVNGTVSTIAGSNTPVAPDVNGPTNWRNTPLVDSVYWYSVYGFHVNGVDDAHDLLSLTVNANIPYYYYMIYWPEFNPGEDFTGPIFLNAAQDSLKLVYGLAAQPMPANTTVSHSFQLLGQYGTYPSSGPAISYASQLLNAGGYYFEKTSDVSYDMISRTDSRIWITWILAQ